MSNLSSAIMNLQTPAGDTEVLVVINKAFAELCQDRPMAEVLKALRGDESATHEFLHMLVLAYKIGHRDARHGAADLAAATGSCPGSRTCRQVVLRLRPSPTTSTTYGLWTTATACIEGTSRTSSKPLRRNCENENHILPQ